MSAVMGPIIGMLKPIVAGFVVVAVAYIVAIFVLQKRITNRRQYRTWRDGLHLVAISVMVLWAWFVAAHQ